MSVTGRRKIQVREENDGQWKKVKSSTQRGSGLRHEGTQCFVLNHNKGRKLVKMKLKGDNWSKCIEDRPSVLRSLMRRAAGAEIWTRGK